MYISYKQTYSTRATKQLWQPGNEQLPPAHPQTPCKRGRLPTRALPRNRSSSEPRLVLVMSRGALSSWRSSHSSFTYTTLTHLKISGYCLVDSLSVRLPDVSSGTDSGCGTTDTTLCPHGVWWRMTLMCPHPWPEWKSIPLCDDNHSLGKALSKTPCHKLTSTPFERAESATVFSLFVRTPWEMWRGWFPAIS